MRLSQRSRRQGFTLIELLVVITIMITLMAMGMGAYQRAISAVRKVESLNNLRQMGIAMQSIAAGQSGRLPSEPQDNAKPISIFYTILDGMGEGAAMNAADKTTVPIKAYLDPARRTPGNVKGKRDYGYATSNGNSAMEILGGVDPGNIAKGAGYTATLSVLWMDPKKYLAGDPGDGNWVDTNNSRSTAQAYKDGQGGSASTMGSPHSTGIPTLLASGTVINVPYTWPAANWTALWDTTSTQVINFGN